MAKIFEMASLLGREFRDAMSKIDGCQTCNLSARPGFVWLGKQGKWAVCWECNKGNEPTFDISEATKSRPRMPIVDAAAVIQMPAQPIQLPPASQNHEITPKVIPVTTPQIITVEKYTNTQRKPYMRTKSEKKYVCAKCNTRGYVPGVCRETGCVGQMAEQKIMHIRVIPHGKMHDILVFMHLLHAGDPEWINPKKCGACDSVIINCPTLQQKEMFKLAKQCGLKKLKIKRWWPEEKCLEKQKEAGVVL